MDSRAELLAVLETIDSTFEAFYLAFWEGAEYRPPFHIRFDQEFEAKASAVVAAKGEFMRTFRETPVAFAIPIVKLAAPRFGTASDWGWEEEEVWSWVEKAAEKVNQLVGKGKPEKKK